jgi:hypothetical protein
MNKKQKIATKREKTKQVISQKWTVYKIKKERLEGRIIGSMRKQALKEKLLQKTRKEISTQWGNYSGFKEGVLKDSLYNGLQFEKRLIQDTVKSDIFKVKNINNIEGNMETLFYSKQGKYVLVTLKLKRNDVITYFSDSFTLESLESLQENEKSVYESILQKLSFNTAYSGYEIISIHLRVIYKRFTNENPAKNKIKNKTRKNKR